ncbi:MAG: response regulator transcription factor [Flavonifractor plautii]
MAKTIRVMVAEDFPLLREDFCDVVSAQSDMEVVGSAASGEEIVALADTVPCDVILMDIEMETIDAGIRAAEVITARHPEVKILFLTAHETDDMITSAMGTGAVDYVVKGCEEERLLEHIRRASEGRAELDPNPEHRHAGVRPSAPQRALPDFLHQQRGPPDAGGARAGQAAAPGQEGGGDRQAPLRGGGDH